MKYISLIAIAFLLILGNGNAQSAADLSRFPKGSSPKEIGKRIADHFVATPHTNFGRPVPPKVITYPETCTWYGALTFAKETGDKKLTTQLAERFEPLFGARDTLIPIPDHVDYTVFGAVPFELYRQTKQQKYFDLGKRFGDHRKGRE
jgi:unsaturated rhamnogalacturonyl hydrolase